MPRQTEPRDRGPTCGQPFAATQDTPVYRVQTAADLMTRVLTWLSHGGPTQALVAAFGVDARTVAAWLPRAGQHGRRGHQPVMQPGRVDLQHVQADALWVTRVGRRGWLAMALAVPSRRWLGGISSPQRELALIPARVQLGRSWARRLAILVCVEGLASDVTAFLRVFRHPGRTGGRGRPPLGLERGGLRGQVGQR